MGREIYDEEINIQPKKRVALTFPISNSVSNRDSDAEWRFYGETIGDSRLSLYELKCCAFAEKMKRYFSSLFYILVRIFVVGFFH